MVGPLEKFVATLSADERMLVTLRDELYDGSWDQMLKDLKKLKVLVLGEAIIDEYHY